MMACQQPAWPALPRHLLGSVLARLPSLADRVRLRAVCRPWRVKLLALPAPPPPLPWLALPLAGTAYDVANNKTYRLQIPNQDPSDNMVFLEQNDGPCYSAGDNMFFFLHQDAADDDAGRCCCSLVDGLSGAATPLPELAALLQQPHTVNTNKMKIEKATVSSSSSSSSSSAAASSRPDNRLLAVLAWDGNKSRVFISTCRPAAGGETTNTCVVMREFPRIVDIAFFRGKLFAHLAMYYELVAVDLSNGCLDGDDEPPQVKKTYTSWIWPPDLPAMYLEKDLFFADHNPKGNFEHYLVECNDKLLMVRGCVCPNPLDCWFEVFEADLGHGPRLGRWIKKARGLDGWALFVGKPCSRAVRASASGVEGGARGDCIYFVGDYGNPFQHSGVYSMADEAARPLLKSSVSGKFKRTRDNYQRWRFPAWFFPVEV